MWWMSFKVEDHYDLRKHLHVDHTQLFSLGPELWFFGEDQKCSWGSKMKNKPNFSLITGVYQTWGRGEDGSATWEFFQHNPFFFLSDDDPNELWAVGKLIFEMTLCYQIYLWTVLFYLMILFWLAPPPGIFYATDYFFSISMQ